MKFASKTILYYTLAAMIEQFIAETEHKDSVTKYRINA